MERALPQAELYTNVPVTAPMPEAEAVPVRLPVGTVPVLPLKVVLIGPLPSSSTLFTVSTSGWLLACVADRMMLRLCPSSMV